MKRRKKATKKHQPNLAQEETVWLKGKKSGADKGDFPHHKKGTYSKPEKKKNSKYQKIKKYHQKGKSR